MTTIAFHQYCNISFSGGSYASSPIKSGITIPKQPRDSQTTPINNGIMTAKHSNPPKFGVSDSSASFAMGRRQFIEKVIDDHTRRIKTSTIGRTSIVPNGQPLSYKRYDMHDTKRALAKARSHGYVAPVKKGALENPYMSGGSAKRGFLPPNTSANSDGCRHSAFLSRHLKNRLACPVTDSRNDCIKPTSTNIESATYNDFPYNHTNIVSRNVRVSEPHDNTVVRTSIFMPHYLRYRIACDDCSSYTTGIEQGQPIVIDDNKFSRSLPDHIKDRIACGDC